MYDKTAVHFGGGAIGRGFVGEILHNSGYEVVFVDVMDKIIDALNENPHYTVTEIGEEGEREFNIDHYRAINSKYDEPKVIQEIAKAETVTCAVGPNILKFIAPVIAKGIEARPAGSPVAVIACENAINATDTLADFIKQHLSEETLAILDDKARFANSAVDRIVPHQDANAGLNIKIERFYEWCVELPSFKGVEHPDIKGVHFVKDLAPYIERKLFTVNTAHATAAYYGYQRNKALIHDAMVDPEIHEIVRSCLKETAHLITNKHEIDAAEQNEYVDMIVDRISNPALEDRIERVGRAPLRKLSRNERFIGPASQLAEMGENIDSLLGAIEMAFRFQNVKDDAESEKLGQLMKELTPPQAVTTICGIEQGHPLYEKLVKIVEKVQAST